MEFFPSEIARLVLGYLKEEKCLKSWQTFVEESSNLKEYFHLYKEGKLYSTNVNGKSLLDIFNEYYVLKFQAISNDQIESPGKKSCFSQSELFKSINNDTIEEIVKNAVDLVFQKYLSSVCSNRACSPSDFTLEVDTSESRSERCVDKENQLTFTVNTIKKSEVIDRIKNITCKKNAVKNNLDTNQLDVELNIANEKNYHASEQLNISRLLLNDTSYHPTNSEDFSNSKSIHLHEIENGKKDGLQSKSSIMNVEYKNNAGTSDISTKQVNNSDGSSRDSCSKSKSNVVEKSMFCAHSEVINKENAVLPSESAQVDDTDLEIVDEIKPVLNNKTQSTSNNNSQIKPSSCFLNNSPSINIQAEDSGMNHAMCNISNAAQVDNSKHNGNPSSSQRRYLSNNGLFSNQPIQLNEMPFCSIPTYISPNFTSDGSFVPSNAQYNFLLNTPVTSNGTTLNGSFLSVPRFQVNNVLSPVLTAVDTTSVKNSLTVPLNNVLNPVVSSASAFSGMSVVSPEVNTVLRSLFTATNIVTVNEDSLVPSNGSEITTNSTNAIGRCPILPEVPNTVINSEFTVAKTAHDVSNFQKASKKKSCKHKGFPNHKNAKKGVLLSTEQTENDQKGFIKKKNKKKDLSKKRKTEKGEYLFPDEHLEKTGKNFKRKYSKQKGSPKKKKLNFGNFILSDEQPKQNFEHPENEHILCLQSETKETFDKNFDGNVSVSPLSDCLNHSDQLLASKSESEILKQLEKDNQNRVLKVVLADMFVNNSFELNSAHNQCLNFNSDSVGHNENNEFQISNSEKLAIKSRRSSRIQSKKKAKIALESKIMDSVSLQQEENVTNTPDFLLLTDEIKSSSSKGRAESTEASSTFNMTTAVLNSMEEARQRIIQAQKHHSELSNMKTVNLQNSSKYLPSEVPVAKKKSSFQNTIHDACENIKIEAENTDKVINDGKECINLATSNDDSVGAKKNLNEYFTKEKTETCVNFIHNKNRIITSKESFVQCKNTTSTDSNFRKQNLSQKVLNEVKDNEKKKIISSNVSKRNSSDTIDGRIQAIVNDFAVKRKQKVLSNLSFSTQTNFQCKNSPSSKHCVDVNSDIETPITRHSNNEEKCLDQYNAEQKECLGGSHNSEILETSDSSNLISRSESFSTISRENSDFTCQSSKANVLSVLASTSVNTNILGLMDNHSEIKLQSVIAETSSMKEKVSNILPSGQFSESQECVLISTLQTKNNIAKCETNDIVITRICSVEGKKS